MELLGQAWALQGLCMGASESSVSLSPFLGKQHEYFPISNPYETVFIAHIIFSVFSFHSSGLHSKKSSLQ